jgi:hypothetical protein
VKPHPEPAFLSEPPEREWAGDWRKDDEREERLAELYADDRQRAEDAPQ